MVRVPVPALPRAREIAPVFAPALVAWQRAHGRHDLPWQGTRDPYRVWLSEIMLQQTQVATVRAYYARFLERFPDVAALAAAPLDDVLALWSGLGYYSRARNLHRCAQLVMERHAGAFPRDPEALAELPGIGRSTAAAIAAFCFGVRVSILDGNVKRVLARVLAFGGDVTATAGDRALWASAQALVPPPALEDAAATMVMTAYTQGLMDLGATVCQPRQPCCGACPLAAFCAAHADGMELAYPVKGRKLRRGARVGYLLWLVSDAGTWLAPRPASGIWGGLWSLPVFESEEERRAVIVALPGARLAVLPAFKHAFTHFDWQLQPLVVHLDDAAAARVPAALAAAGQPAAGAWFADDAWPALGLPAPIRTLLAAGMPERQGQPLLI